MDKIIGRIDRFKEMLMKKFEANDDNAATTANVGAMPTTDNDATMTKLQYTDNDNETEGRNKSNLPTV